MVVFVSTGGIGLVEMPLSTCYLYRTAKIKKRNRSRIPAKIRLSERGEAFSASMKILNKSITVGMLRGTRSHFDNWRSFAGSIRFS